MDKRQARNQNHNLMSVRVNLFNEQLKIFTDQTIQVIATTVI